MKSKYRKAVFVVAYRKENNKILYLILKRKLHWIGWEFPKGGMNAGEKILPAVKREVKEETGQHAVKINNHYFHGKYKYPKKLRDRPGVIGQTYILYSAELKDRKVNVDNREHSRHKWLVFNKAVKKLTYPLQKKCLKIVNKNLKNKLK